MTAYGVLRLVHSYWRWVVVLAGLVVLVRSAAALRSARPWSAADNRASVLFVSAVDLQFLLGIILYFGFSPFWTALRTQPHQVMHDAATRFAAVEHPFGMIVALVIVHIGRVRARRAADDRGKQRALFVSTLLFFVLVLASVPWSWRSVVGRPLFRTTL